MNEQQAQAINHLIDKIKSILSSIVTPKEKNFRLWENILNLFYIANTALEKNVHLLSHEEWTKVRCVYAILNEARMTTQWRICDNAAVNAMSLLASVGVLDEGLPTTGIPQVQEKGDSETCHTIKVDLEEAVEGVVGLKQELARLVAIRALLSSSGDLDPAVLVQAVTVLAGQ